jgi:ribosomal protein S3
MNHLKSRIKLHTKSNNLKGYKMHLTGRFTRKQRASYYWFSRGKVPLNTISAFVDFAFFTIPLTNSAITVKVWLYKSDELLNNYYLKIY